MELKEKLDTLPSRPGCYLFKDAAGHIIYVGKAKNLRHRVRQYFHSSRARDIKTLELVAAVADVDTIITDNEIEALILESNLIKRHQPRFNVLLKDDKQYPHLKLTIGDPYPRLYKVRRIQKDEALYFGPYLPASLADRICELVNREFQLRPCSDDVFRTYRRRGRPCLQFQIKRCLGPCVPGLCSEEQYQEAVQDVRKLLEGKNRDLADDLRRRMEQAAAELRFEAAARYRDLIGVVEHLGDVQKMASVTDSDVDTFGYYRDGPKLALYLFTMREGRVIGKREFFWEDIRGDFDPRTFLSEILVQYYSGAAFVPAEVHLPVDVADRPLIERWLTEKRGRRVRLKVPRRGRQRDLVDLAIQNAKLAFEQRFRVLAPDRQEILQELARLLRLPGPPRRIEAFDISNIQGTDAVASLVVCEDGVMKKRDYRRYAIKTVRGPDDYASMREVISRCYARRLREQKPLPDLILVDGGKGQLSAAAAALDELGLVTQPLAALAKREEVIYVRGREDEPIRLDRHSPILHLIQVIRDEAHRFAITYHRLRRKKRHLTSELLAIPGIGERRKTRLLRNFGSLERIKRASVAELTPFVGEELARRIHAYFSGRERQ
ncbi:MAG: excinuclease ABC subunit UvrC [Acidobacteria bacterium]|nr:MAG: excinuclease ABC subunit UvrC [Acidobacteriota bacterium]